MLGIIVRTQFEGIHCYPDAPEEVAFLRTPHRHIFHIEVEIETFHDDRELEFIMVKHEIDKFIAIGPTVEKNETLGSQSCEIIAKRISAFIKSTYLIPEGTVEPRSGWEREEDSRKVNVTVFEDLENGAFIKEF